MRYPLHVATDMIKWQAKNKLQGRKRYPVVLMLEPLYTCNLACVGCTPERHSGDLKDRLTLSESLQAVDESGAPVVSICGGEPTIYPELPELVGGIIERKRHVIICTNALLLDRFYKKAQPHKRVTINIHLDGLRETHDFVCAREGVFDKAIEMIKLGKQLGYTVCTNTTIYRETQMAEIEEMFALLTQLGIDNMLVSPGYHYEALQDNHFLFRQEIHQKFKRVLELSKKYRFGSTPLFLEFAAGEREYPCTPWGNVTRTPFGWKGPCYLIGEKYFKTWDEFWNGVDWNYWETRTDLRCHNCLMHSGFEASVTRTFPESSKDVMKMARWMFS
jgi:hopanoid biosynthesis associated radical SAM protein HpnH